MLLCSVLTVPFLYIPRLMAGEINVCDVWYEHLSNSLSHYHQAHMSNKPSIPSREQWLKQYVRFLTANAPGLKT